MTTNGLKTTALTGILKGVASSGLFRVVVNYITGTDNKGSKIPDIEIEVFCLGFRVLHHKFVL